LATKLASLEAAKQEESPWLHVLFPPALLSQDLPVLWPTDKQLALFSGGINFWTWWGLQAPGASALKYFCCLVVVGLL